MGSMFLAGDKIICERLPVRKWSLISFRMS
jgi:hypothetical protein